ncbi:hypothetical protein [Saccharothrix hoggarensis]|uniref:Uncharacterized protein n=1 Tax=Saccharothrix hoggarensis TaxID=913853 RepID=A0ABW3QWF4_9PSEU
MNLVEEAERRARQLVDAITPALLGTGFRATSEPLRPGLIQQRVLVTAPDKPKIEVIVEEAQAVLSVDNLPLTGIVYEYDLNEDLPPDLVKHLISVTRQGYRYVRLPLYDRLVVGNALTVVTHDLGWPPILVRKWRPDPQP